MVLLVRLRPISRDMKCSKFVDAPIQKICYRVCSASVTLLNSITFELPNYGVEAKLASDTKVRMYFIFERLRVTYIGMHPVSVT